MMDYVFQHSQREGTARLMHLAMAWHADTKGGGIRPSTATLAKMAGVGERQARYTIRALEDSGDVAVVNAGGKGPHDLREWRMVVADQQVKAKPRDPATTFSPEFEIAWAAYPRRDGGNSKPAAWRAWSARIRDGVAPNELIDGTKRYATFVRAAGKEGTPYVKMAQTFYGPDQHWKEPWAIQNGSGPKTAPTCQSADDYFKSMKEQRPR